MWGGFSCADKCLSHSFTVEEVRFPTRIPRSHTAAYGLPLFYQEGAVVVNGGGETNTCVVVV